MRRGKKFALQFSILTGVVALSSCAAFNPPVNVCFSPGNCSNSIAAEIGQAKTELLIQAYSLTAKPITDAVVKARQSGVNVEIVLDNASPVARNNAVYFSSLNGIPTYLDANHAVADGNVIIIDKATVITGSFNFTKEADAKNAENVLIIKSTALANAYINNWDEHKSHSDAFVETEQSQPAKSVKKKAGKKKKSSP